jgi:hypothetical protein
MQWRLWPHADEPALAFAARSAVYDGHERLPTYLQRYGPLKAIDERDLLSGREAAQTALAEAFNLERNVFAPATPVRSDADGWSMGGEPLPALAHPFRSLRACRACLDEDMVESRRDPRVAPHFRALWALDCVRACPRHRVALEPLDCHLGSIGQWADGGLSRLAARPAPAPPSEAAILYAEFAARRLGFHAGGAEPCAAPSLPMKATTNLAIALGEFLLAEETLEPVPDDRGMVDRQSVQRGFAQLCASVEDTKLALRRAARRRLGRAPASHRLLTPQQAFGKLDAVVEGLAEDPRAREARWAFVAAAVAETRVQADHWIVAKDLAEIDQRAVVDLAELPRRLGTGRDRADKLAKRLRPPAQACRPTVPGPHVFRGRELAALEADHQGELTRPASVAAWGATEAQIEDLLRFGIAERTADFRGFFASDIRRQLSALYGAAPTIRCAARGHVLLTKACAVAPSFSVGRVCKLLRDGYVRPVGVLKDRPGIAAIVLDREALLRCADPSAASRLALEAEWSQGKIVGYTALARRLNCSKPLARAVAERFLRGASALRLPTRHGHRSLVVAPCDVDAFLSCHVSINELDQRTLQNRRLLLDCLRRSHIHPIPTPGQGDGGFYPREQAEATLGLRL